MPITFLDHWRIPRILHRPWGRRHATVSPVPPYGACFTAGHQLLSSFRGKSLINDGAVLTTTASNRLQIDPRLSLFVCIYAKKEQKTPIPHCLQHAECGDALEDTARYVLTHTIDKQRSASGVAGSCPALPKQVRLVMAMLKKRVAVKKFGKGTHRQGRTKEQ